MKKKAMIALFALAAVSFTSCNTSKAKAEEETPVEETQKPAEMDQTITVTGEVVNIESGKDGYMATVKTAEGKEYTATISIVNLQKSGGTFKRYEVGDTATVTGKSWSNDEGKQYITATAIE